MARGRRSPLGTLILILFVLILIAVIVGGVFEIAIAPVPSSIKSTLESDKISVEVYDQDLVLTTSGRAAAVAALAVYGYTNTSLTDKVDISVEIAYTQEKDGATNTYRAIVIYFDSMSDAITAMKGIKDKVKEDQRVTMFRGNTLIIGQKPAVLQTYRVIH